MNSRSFRPSTSPRTIRAACIHEVAPMATALASAEAAEGIAAFLGKRAPDFAALRRRG